MTCLILAAAAAAIAVGLIIHAVTRPRPGGPVLVAVVFFVFSVAAVRGSMTSVDFVPSPPRVVVRNPLRRYSFAPAEIDGFEQIRSWSSNAGNGGRYLIKMRRRDGAQLTCVGASAWGSVQMISRQLGSALTHLQHPDWPIVPTHPMQKPRLP